MPRTVDNHEREKHVLNTPDIREAWRQSGQLMIEYITEHKATLDAAIREGGWHECRWHGWVGDDHWSCRRPGESAMEYTGRYLGERRDV